MKKVHIIKHVLTLLFVGEVCFAQNATIAQQTPPPALSFVEKAIQGDSVSLYRLGAKYANGVDLPQNNIMAYALWELALKTTDPKLHDFIDLQKTKLIKRMEVEEINEAQKRSLYPETLYLELRTIK